jgi:hypothetical protein
VGVRAGLGVGVRAGLGVGVDCGADVWVGGSGLGEELGDAFTLAGTRDGSELPAPPHAASASDARRTSALQLDRRTFMMTSK